MAGRLDPLPLELNRGVAMPGEDISLHQLAQPSSGQMVFYVVVAKPCRHIQEPETSRHKRGLRHTPALACLQGRACPQPFIGKIYDIGVIANAVANGIVESDGLFPVRFCPGDVFFYKTA